jgi:type VI secretion system secreted protein Hcp
MGRGDMFLKVTSARAGSVTGEANDPSHAGEIDVESFSWGMKAVSAMGAGGAAVKSTLEALHIVKQVDRASTALMSVLRGNDPVTEAVLTVRKAGGTAPLDYFAVSIFEGRITAYDVACDPLQNNRLLERLSFSFNRIEVSYTAQDPSGAGLGASSFSAEATT